MSHILHRHTRAELPFVTGGEGAYLFDSTGKRYLDASGGAAAPFDPTLAIHAAVKRKAMAHGLLCYPMAGTIDGHGATMY